MRVKQYSLYCYRTGLFSTLSLHCVWLEKFWGKIRLNEPGKLKRYPSAGSGDRKCVGHYTHGDQAHTGILASLWHAFSGDNALVSLSLMLVFCWTMFTQPVTRWSWRDLKVTSVWDRWNNNNNNVDLYSAFQRTRRFTKIINWYKFYSKYNLTKTVQQNSHAHTHRNRKL